MEIKNKYVCDFYKKNAFIDYERANVLLVDLFKNCMYTSENDQKIELPNTFHETNKMEQQNMESISYTSTNKICEGFNGEAKIEMLLNKLNPNEEIIQNTDENTCGDFIIIGQNRPNIIVENRVSDVNIKSGEIDFFIQSCKNNKSNGIFISQHTGIIGKNNFEMDIIDSNVVIFIHSVEYDEDKIKLAFESMNTLYNKIKMLQVDMNTTISKEILYEINKEYQLFITQKEELQKYIKGNHSQMLSQIENIKLTHLTSYLSTHFSNIDKKGIHKCNLCNFYTSNTLKGMAAHKRGCKKKYPVVS